MLIEFQKALADLTASPALCRAVRQDVGIVSSKGMEANCMLYRANRLAPIALNLPETCEAIREDLNRLVSTYWDSEPETDVHFLIEADRFCRFLQSQSGLSPKAKAALARESAIVAAKLALTRDAAIK